MFLAFLLSIINITQPAAWCKRILSFNRSVTCRISFSKPAQEKEETEHKFVKKKHLTPALFYSMITQVIGNGKNCGTGAFV